MTSNRAFPGRVIFDHLPKTAGQAINAWLVEALGTGCVTANLIGHHRELIRKYGGIYSVISGHVEFYPGEGLDPRYQYMTLLRDPVDRVVSWLYFLISNHDDTQLPEVREAARDFLENDGRKTPDSFVGTISNAYVEHFCRINGSGLESDDEKITNALAAIKEYDVVGVYEEMPRFLANVAGMVGLPPRNEIAHVNVTSQRPKIDQLSIVLRKRIVAMNQLDLRLYSKVLAWIKTAKQSNAMEGRSLITSVWKKYEPVLAPDRVVTTPDVTILSAALREGYEIRHGQLMTFDVEFFLTREVSDLELGIHLFDSDRKWAFGINSTMLGQSRISLPSGSYRVSHHLIAELPTGTYTAGFAFSELLPKGKKRELAWQDVMFAFQVYHQAPRPFVGHSYLPSDLSFCRTRTPTCYFFSGEDVRLSTLVGLRVGNNIVSTDQAGCLVFGQYVPLLEGNYQVLIHGTLGEGGLAGAHMDVVAHSGNHVLAEHALEEREDNGCLIVQPISLHAPFGDIEIRVWVTENTDIKISAIEIVECAL